MLTIKDKEQIASHGITEEQVRNQLESFKQGFGFLPVVNVAKVKDGVERFSDAECAEMVEWYDKTDVGKVVKFVPASGAATRMFKDLFEFVNDDKRGAVVDKLMENLPRFAFYNKLQEYITPESDPKATVSAIVGAGLEYGVKPKGLILFHRYEEANRTAVEEHLAEGAMYAASDGVVNIHFTVSPEHQAGFESLIAAVQPKYESKYGVRYNVSYSQQQSSTDTVAVNLDNTPFRNADGALLFRPAGHGALIENLNAIEADLIFVKNIDNVTTDRLKADTIKYKKVLAATLLKVQRATFDLLAQMDEQVDEALLIRAEKFVCDKLQFKLPADFGLMSNEDKANYLRRVLNRPIRVCGMVRNEGEPGGGPFWVLRADGAQSLQIAEPSQVAPDKAFMLKDGTHFNPVDLVCGVMNYKGEKFDLANYVDHSTCFISEKSKDGKALKALELPGLWNGAMADWNTIFVETPVSTFTPVKVVTDLLRDQHQ